MNNKIPIIKVGRDFDLENKDSISYKEKKSKNSYAPIANYLDIGYHLVSPIVGGVLFGLYIDTKLKTRPVFTLVFLFLGVVLSFYNLYKLSKSIK